MFITVRTIMNQGNAALKCLGVLVILSVFGLDAQARSYPNPQAPKADLKQNQSSSLGGPITPTQSDLFKSDTPLLQPITLEQESSSSFFDFKSVRPTSSKRPAAPFVDDPPRPSGVGIINVKTD